MNLANVDCILVVLLVPQTRHGSPRGEGWPPTEAVFREGAEASGPTMMGSPGPRDDPDHFRHVDKCLVISFLAMSF